MAWWHWAPRAVAGRSQFRKSIGPFVPLDPGVSRDPVTVDSFGQRQVAQQGPDLVCFLPAPMWVGPACGDVRRQPVVYEKEYWVVVPFCCCRQIK